MKKILLSIISFVTFTTVTYAQVCTVDPNAAGLIYPMQPDSTTNPGEYYEETITITVPTDTTVSIITVYLDSVVLDSVQGLPAGLTYGCGSSLGNCTYLGGTQGCFKISGTVDNSVAVGIYPITFHVTITGVLDSTGSGGEPIVLPYALEAFNLYVGNVGVQTLNTLKFDVIQNIPNPFNGTTSIKFNCPISGTVDFTVFDILGKQVHNKKIDAVTGANVIKYSSENLAPGAYFYMLSNGTERITKRMVVSGK